MSNAPKIDNDLICDMANELRQNRVPYAEYLLFGFSKLGEQERRKFVSDIERVDISNQLNNPENEPIFYDKSITYQYFKDYFHRDLIAISKFDNEEFELFSEFAIKHFRFICKPVDGGCGKGIRVFDMRDYSERDMFDKLKECYHRPFVVEELIVQKEELGKLHPNSVNTVRMPTIRFDDRVELVHPFFRVGQGDSVTDNAGSGGIICALDVDTGVVIAAADEFGNVYETHPDTGFKLIGYQMPDWEEAKKLVKELALIVPDNRYSSWDIAYTDKGWTMIEVNARGQFLWQYATKIGFREEIEKILHEINGV